MKHHRAIQKRFRRAHAWPIEGAPYQSFFAAIRHDVAKAYKETFLITADDAAVVSTSPESSTPSRGTTRSSSQVTVEVFHEAGQLLCIVGPEQQVIVVGEKLKRKNPNPVSALGST
jgi:hypothetical protein